MGQRKKPPDMGAGEQQLWTRSPYIRRRSPKRFLLFTTFTLADDSKRSNGFPRARAELGEWGSVPITKPWRCNRLQGPAHGDVIPLGSAASAASVSVAASTVAVVLIVALFLLPDSDDGLTPVDQLNVGDCFIYPGDGVTAERVGTTPCSEIHFAEVYATTEAGDTDSCVSLFESYTGANNYWATGYIIGFLEIDESRMLCYLYGAEDFAGSLRDAL